LGSVKNLNLYWFIRFMLFLDSIFSVWVIMNLFFDVKHLLARLGNKTDSYVVTTNDMTLSWRHAPLCRHSLLPCAWRAYCMLCCFSVWMCVMRVFLYIRSYTMDRAISHSTRDIRWSHINKSTCYIHLLICNSVLNFFVCAWRRGLVLFSQ